MSAPEQQQAESRSSVAVTMNAKGEAQVAVKVYDQPDLALLGFTLDRLREEAVRTYTETVKAVRAPAAVGASV